MISKFLGRLLGGADASEEGSEDAAGASESYRDFDIQAKPVKETGGWRIAGTISKTVDGDEKVHQFVRADTCADADSAASMTLRKARQLIDEQGESIFR